MEAKDQLSNEYVRGYYNEQVGALGESYTDSRWNASPTHKFDYNQTRRTLDRALGGRRYASAVEIGPGDAVWTEQIKTHVDGGMHLVEQSNEMYEQAKKKLAGDESITIERSDFMESHPPEGVDLVVTLRCFEYFTDKPGGIKKMFTTLAPGGRLVMVTKNSKLYTTKGAQHKLVHSDQLSKDEMMRLLQDNGFHVEHVYPATLRWKSKYAPMRFVFDVFHKLGVWSEGRVWIPFLFTYAAESYVYVASRPAT